MQALADSGKDLHMSSVRPWQAWAALTTAGGRARRERTRTTARTWPVWCSACGVRVLREPVTAGPEERWAGGAGGSEIAWGLRGASPELKADLGADGSQKMLQGRLVASVQACRRPRGQSPESWAECLKNHAGEQSFSVSRSREPKEAGHRL